MSVKPIYVDLTDRSYDADSTVWQYDYGRELRIQDKDLPTAVEVHFSTREKDGEAITRIGTTRDGVTSVIIPDSMLENNDARADYWVYIFIYLADSSACCTMKRIDLLVLARPKPEPFDRPEDAELFRETVVAVNEAADRAEAAETEAETAQTAAEQSAAAAAASAAEAADSADEAATSEANAAKFAQEAGSKATAAEQSATDAAGSAAAARQSVQDSAVFATAAKQYRDDAARDANTAKERADTAKESADTAKAEKDEAVSAAASADLSAKNSAASANASKRHSESSLAYSSSAYEMYQAAKKSAEAAAKSAQEAAEAGGSGGGVNVTGAAPGQLIVVKEVDADGVPTAWETMDRTHWAEGGMVEVLAECQPPFIESDNMFVITEGVTPLSVGEEYIVNWNGVEYNCIAQISPGEEGGVLLGNNLAFGGLDSGEPFVLGVGLNEGIVMLAIMALDGTTDLTISIRHEGETVHKLDSKYLPDPLFGGGDKQTEVFPAMDVHFANNGQGYNTRFQVTNMPGDVKLPFPELDYDEYIVYWGGVPYECAYQSGTGNNNDGSTVTTIMLGNVSKLTNTSFSGIDMTIDSGEPFLIHSAFIHYPSGESGSVITFYQFGEENVESVSVQIFRNEYSINKIPAKYLPQGVPYVEEGELTDTLVFDGNMEGKTAVDSGGGSYFVNLSSAYVEPSKLIGGTMTFVSDDNEMVPSGVYDIDESMMIDLKEVFGVEGYGVGEMVIILAEDLNDAGRFIPKGINVACIPSINAYVSEIKAPTAAIGVVNVHKLDERCLPDNVCTDVLIVETALESDSGSIASHTGAEIFKSCRIGKNLGFFKLGGCVLPLYSVSESGVATFSAVNYNGTSLVLARVVVEADGIISESKNSSITL